VPTFMVGHIIFVVPMFNIGRPTIKVGTTSYGLRTFETA
jgi:hypothetical protein